MRQESTTLATGQPPGETVGPTPTQRLGEQAGLRSLTASAGPWTQMHLMSLFPGHQQAANPRFSKPVEKTPAHVTPQRAGCALRNRCVIGVLWPPRAASLLWFQCCVLLYWVAPDLPAAPTALGALLGFILLGNVENTCAWRPCAVSCLEGLAVVIEA